MKYNETDNIPDDGILPEKNVESAAIEPAKSTKKLKTALPPKGSKPKKSSKNTIAATVVSSDSQVTKKRGRKPNTDKAAAAISTISTDEAINTISTDEAISTISTDEAPATIVSVTQSTPKRPGRPKGSKNATKPGKPAEKKKAIIKTEKLAGKKNAIIKTEKLAGKKNAAVKPEKLTGKKKAAVELEKQTGIKEFKSKAAETATVAAVTAKRGRKSKSSTETAAGSVPAAAAASSSETKLADQLGYKVINAWEDKNLKRKQVFDFSDGYMSFLNKTKTEREYVKEAVILAEKKGFRNLDAMAEDMRLVPGDRIYRVVKNKLIMMAVIGSNPMVEGVRILGAHVDSPRIDIKQNPLYESNEMAFLKTHYYGGIKKYQWTAIPVAIHGVFVKTDGTTVNVLIGEDEKDPIFTITDLLPHLAKDQYDKKLGDAIAGESMNLLIGSEPYLGEESKEKVKLNTLRLLSEMYGIKEEDFLSAELEIVPAFKARDLGLDRSMIGAYGHDDKVCAYPAMMAVLESEDPKTTSLCILTDKEEIGSVGNTGAESRAMENFLAELCSMSSATPYSDRTLRKCLDHSKMLSADVTAAVDPNFEGTHDKLNASYLGKGIAIMKYSGSRGKSGASDAHAEYVAEVRKILNDAGIAWQTTELGAVDKGGGGTIAMMIANLGVDVIDCGVPVLSMHAPFEVVSKVDLYNTYKAYIAFLK